MLVTKLKEYRERDGLKQADLADLVGVRRETIVNLEKGRYNPSLKLAMDLAAVFHVSVEELFDTAHRLLVKNRCDFVLANDMTEIDENHHRGYLIDPERNIQTFDTKQEIAKGIVQTIYSEVEHR